MSLIQSIFDRVRPPIQERPKTSDFLRGFGSKEEMLLQGFDRIIKSLDQNDRSSLLDSVQEMRTDGAIADKSLDKLCQDATEKEVTIDAPKQRKNIILELLNRIDYQEKRKELIYLMLSDGDLFTQLEFSPSINPSKVGFITDIFPMPVKTMIRNTNELDRFNIPSRSFAQVEDIQNGLYFENPIWFTWPKIIHSRNDQYKGKFFRYGWSMWASGIKIFNIAMMLLEDSAIQRHQAAQILRVHYVGKNSQAPSDPSLIDQYERRVLSRLTNRTTDFAVDGKNEIDEIGGTRATISGVDDIMLAMSILSIAVEYPLDLLSGKIGNSSGGEELFRKEVVLKRAVQSIIKKESKQILEPLIDRELILAGSYGPYRITTFPTSFEDQNKKSKRGLGEMQAFVKAPSRFHEENNDEVSWEEELSIMDRDMASIQELIKKYPDAAQMISRASGRKDPQSGTQGNTSDPTTQQERLTPDQTGTEDR